MDASRFDRFTIKLSNRLTRRQALTTSAASLSALAVATRSHPLSAQDATPEAASAADETSPGFIFVQLAESGTWTPNPDEAGVFDLTLSGTGEQTLYFSMGPDRIVGTVPTELFLNNLGFTPENPPNAAIEVWTPEGARDVLVVQLFNPRFTRTFGDTGDEFLTYEARVLDAYHGEGLEEWLPDVDDDQLPQEFTNVSLFIDSFGCYTLQNCYRVEDDGSLSARIGKSPAGNVRQCPTFAGECVDCSGLGFGSYQAACNVAYPECENRCTVA